MLYLLAFDSRLLTEQPFAMAVGHGKSQRMEFTGFRLHDLDVCAPHLGLLPSVLILSDFASAGCRVDDQAQKMKHLNLRFNAIDLEDDFASLLCARSPASFCTVDDVGVPAGLAAVGILLSIEDSCYFHVVVLYASQSATLTDPGCLRR